MNEVRDPLEPIGPSYGAKSIARQVHFQGPVISESLESALKSHFDKEKLATSLPARELIEIGAVYVNHKRAADTQRLIGAEDLIRVHLSPKRYVLDKKSIREKCVVCETDDYLVVNKPQGLPVHATLDNLHENLLSAFNFPVHVTHRLDVPTSGLILIAKTPEYQTLFNGLIATRRVQKTYLALTKNAVESGLYRHFMKVSSKAPKVICLEPPPSEEIWEECLLKIVKCISHSEFRHVLEISLLTGRTHQIRAQLSFLGAPLVGDEMYGGVSEPSGIFGLHASGLEFDCPKTGARLSFGSSAEF